jgi:hypothetical protein
MTKVPCFDITSTTAPVALVAVTPKPMKRRLRAAGSTPTSAGRRPEIAIAGSDKAVTGARAMRKTAPRVGFALALLLTIVLGVWPSPARADGDPASDVLANQVLFLPTAAGISKLEELRLASLIDAANHDALPIRVAIIASPSDLGAVTELWDQPRAYARFLGLELALTGQDGVLAVMPNGVGFYSPGHSAPATYALVGRVASGRSGPALVSAAQAAVMSVAQAARVRLPAPARMAGMGLRAPTPWRPTTDRVFGFVVLAALAVAGAACFFFTRWPSAVPTREGSTRERRNREAATEPVAAYASTRTSTKCTRGDPQLSSKVIQARDHDVPRAANRHR